MNQHELRDLHGRIYVTNLNGLVIPWKPLSIAEFIKYEEEIVLNIHPAAILENEIFRKCVLDDNLLKDFDLLPAGIVTTVAQNIMEHSGVNNLELLNASLDEKRNTAASVMRQLVRVIIRAFPAYIPEEVYAMDYDTFMLRAAEAEALLLETGYLQEPMNFVNQNQPKKKRGPVATRNLKDFWEQQNTPKDKKEETPKGDSNLPPVTERPKVPEAKRKEVFDNIKKGISPVLTAEGAVRKKYVGLEMTQKNAGDDAKDPVDAHQMKQFMIQQAQTLYKDTIEKMPFYKQQKK